VLKLIPFLLRKGQTGLGFLAGKSDDNPKKAAGLGVVGGLLTLFGVSPESIHAVGDMLVKLGELLKGL